VESHLEVPAPCPACLAVSDKIVVFIDDGKNSLALVSCGCGTLFYPGAVAPDYEVVESSASFFMRIDQAEGIDSALMPLFSSPDLSDYSVVDIGCGLGFTSDFVRFQGRECLAFDPSSAAQMSVSNLGISIRQELANSQNTNTKGPKLIFCSEVIEHVDSPPIFMDILKSIAGDDGFLIATTPNAEFVTPEHSTSTILAMLAPTQHLFLLSPGALENLAIESGFLWAYTWTQNERLFLVAGPHSVTLDNCFPRNEYVDYLLTRLKDESINKLIRFRSFGYRLFKEQVHAGMYAEASVLWDELAKCYGELNLNLNAPYELMESYDNAAGKIRILPNPKFYPYNSALLMFLKGTLLIAHNHDRIAAKPYFDVAIQLSNLYREVFTSDIFQAYDVEIQSVKDWAQSAKLLHNL
jgi:hypothetical protein